MHATKTLMWKFMKLTPFYVYVYEQLYQTIEWPCYLKTGLLVLLLNVVWKLDQLKAKMPVFKLLSAWYGLTSPNHSNRSAPKSLQVWARLSVYIIFFYFHTIYHTWQISYVLLQIIPLYKATRSLALLI